MNQAVVLVGGFGQRLKSVVSDRPKALAEIAGTPFLDYLIRRLAAQGIDRVILSTGYLADMVHDFAGDGSQWGVDVVHVREPSPLGTGGALRFVRDTLSLDEPFLAMNGDSFFSGSMATLGARHERNESAQLTIALAHVADASRFGTVDAEPETGVVLRFVEKDGLARPAWINAGVYAVNPDVLSVVEPDKKVSVERDVFPGLVGRGLFAEPFEGASFLDIGTPEDLARAPQILRSGGFE